jgi:ketosteroid isomerase-like protein
MGQAHAVVEKFYGSFQRSDWPGVRDLFAPDCITVTPSGAMNVDQHEQFGKAFKAAFPAARMELRHAVESGDWIAVEGHFVGKHEHDLVGPSGTIKAQGKDLKMPYADFFRISEGKIVEHRVYWDQVGMLVQLGAMPTPA